MLKLLALLLDLVSFVFALLAPVAIVHWLLGIIGIPQLAGPVQALDGFFQPLNAAINALMGPGNVPHIAYQGRDVTITQGILGFVLTVIFFALAGLATATRSLDKKMTVASDLARSKARAQERAAAQAVVERKTASNTRILLEILYPFDDMAPGAERFKSFAQRGGRVLSSRPDAWVLAFEDAEAAMSYAVGSALALRQYYAGLRPMDPQPPFRVALHAVEPNDEATRAGVSLLHLILRYAGENQIVFSQGLEELMRLQPPKTSRQTQSMGMFDLNDHRQQEIYRLFYAPGSWR